MEPRIFRPPVIAVWLVGFFIPNQQRETIQGDLVEEFSTLASASGVAAARRWYWRQSISTVAHLVGNGFCAAPWLIAGAVFGGCLALWFGLELADRAVEAPLFVYAVHLNHAKDHAHALGTFWIPWIAWAIQTARFLLVMFVGCLVALAVKGREMLTAMALSLVCAAMSGLVYPEWTISHNAELALPVRVFQLVASIAILLGAAIVRETRFILARRHSRVSTP